MKLSLSSLLLSLCVPLILGVLSARADDVPAGWGIFATPIHDSDFDLTAFAEWIDGTEKPIVNDRDRKPRSVMWVQNSVMGPNEIFFGYSQVPGPRHLRVGFLNSVPVGGILVSGDVKVTVLKPTATYPGDLNDESQWLSGERIENGKVTSDEVEKIDQTALWIFPPGTETKALRFTHTAKPRDMNYGGNIVQAYILPARFANVAPQALPLVKSSTPKASLLNDERASENGCWTNIPFDGSRLQPVSAQDPEWVMLVWPKPVTLRGLGFRVPGFDTADVQVYTGPEDVHPHNADESAWQTIAPLAIARGPSLSTLDGGVSWLDFGKDITCRALRLRITAPFPEKDVVWHWTGASRKGQRVWLGDILAMQALDDKPLESALPVADVQKVVPHPPIPIRFTLPEAGYVTLVIEDSTGKRVRNLVSETPFPAGENIAWWDGTNDLARDPDAAGHGIYEIPAQFVEPGEYHVRGLWRKDIHAAYEFGIYNPGNPPWDIVGHTGGWLSNHCAPMSAVFVPAAKSPTNEPAVYLGSLLTEGPDGIAWVDLDGRKRGGEGSVGGSWTSAPFMARDDGPNADPDVNVYVASVGTDGAKNLELRLTGMTKKTDKPILHLILQPRPAQPGEPPISAGTEICGLAAYNGMLACSLTRENQIFMIDAKAGTVVNKNTVDSPKGLAYDDKGRLLIISGTKVLRFDPSTPSVPPAPVISSGLEDPVGITLDTTGNIYISDRGNSHQVKIFSPDGQFVRAIGHPGLPKAGPYDPMHMNNPRGITVDSNNHLWVAEEDFLPKRVSVWTLDGQLVKAFYGPSKYGGGGSLDPMDQTLFYDADEERGGLQFKLDWDKGTYELTDVYYRAMPDDVFLPTAPETALYFQGTRYLTNCYNSNPVCGAAVSCLFREKDGVAYPVAAMGDALGWRKVFEQNDEFKKLIPPGIDFTNGYHNNFFFIWNDLNGDGKVEPNEIVCVNVPAVGVTVMPDLSFCVADFNGKAMKFAPQGFISPGIPRYDVSKGELIVDGVLQATSDGGVELLLDGTGQFVDTLGVKPFSQYSFSGGKNGVTTWSYPTLWPGLHASHESAVTDRPGEVVGSTRLMGGLFSVKASDAGPFWANNGNMGAFYVFTADGLFVATVFKDIRTAPYWDMPVAQLGMSLDGLSLHDEDFWPTISQAADGKVYMVQGTSLVRLDGFESVKRLPDSALTVSKDDLQKAQDYVIDLEAVHQKEQGRGILQVGLPASPPNMDASLQGWDDSTFVDIDTSGTAAWFNSRTKPHNIRGAIALGTDKLYALWTTADPDLLKNSGEIPTALFKTGGGLDLMIGTDPNANPARRDPAAGDLRLLVSQVKGKTVALLYRPKVPGTQTPPVPFSSPWRTIGFDRVDDVSDQVQLVSDGKGNYEIAVPLKLLGLTPQWGMKIKGDIGLIRGDGTHTLSRTYWSNKATAIVSDVPSEAELTPSLWGTWEFPSKQ